MCDTIHAEYFPYSLYIARTANTVRWAFLSFRRRLLSFAQSNTISAKSNAIEMISYFDQLQLGNISKRKETNENNWKQIEEETYENKNVLLFTVIDVDHC